MKIKVSIVSLSLSFCSSMSNYEKHYVPQWQSCRCIYGRKKDFREVT